MDLKELNKKTIKNLAILNYDAFIAAIPVGENSDKVKRLAELLNLIFLKKNTDIIITSGEKKENLDHLFGHLPFNMVAENGAVYKRNNEWITEFSGNTFWKKILQPVFETTTQNCKYSFIEEKPFSLKWDFSRSEPETGAYHSKQLIKTLGNIINFYNLQIIESIKSIEVMSIEINKSKTLKKLADLNGLESLFLMGEDLSDELTSETFTKGTSLPSGAAEGFHPPTLQKTSNLSETLNLLETLSA